MQSHFRETLGVAGLPGAPWILPQIRGLRTFRRSRLRLPGVCGSRHHAVGSGLRPYNPFRVDGFTVTTPIDQWLGEVSAGIDVLDGESFDMRIGYDGRFGEHVTEHGGNVTLRANF